MLDPQCPHCASHVALFGAGWQRQRESQSKFCPSCHKAVVVQFRASTFVVWSGGFLFASAIGGYFFGAYGFAPFFTAAFVAPLVPSLYLHSGA